MAASNIETASNILIIITIDLNSMSKRTRDKKCYNWIIMDTSNDSNLPQLYPGVVESESGPWVITLGVGPL